MPNWVKMKFRVHLINYLKFENSFLFPFLKSYNIALFIVIHNTVLCHWVQVTISSCSH